MMQAAVYGRLGSDPRAITTKTGKAMATVRVAVQLDDRSEAPLWLGLVTFGKVAEVLLRHRVGDLLSASGRLQRNSWTDKNTGEVREQLEVIVENIVSARTVRLDGPRKRAAGGGKPASQQRRRNPEPFIDDSLDDLLPLDAEETS
jgi:single-strand DNA-binding protein